VSAPTFTVPPELEASEPPERRGIARDEVRLMVVSRSTGEIVHATFRDLPDFLDPGDLLVVNNSATLPAAVPARLAEDGEPVELRFASPVPQMPEESWWVIELRSPDGAEPFDGTRAGERVELPGGAQAAITAPYNGGTRLWLAKHDIGEPVEDYLLRYGHPIRYAYVPDEYPLQTYQTAFALHPGSAEMPSAARPFTPRLVTALVARGIHIAPITLHAGVSSPERDETPMAERYEVPETTARLVNAVHGWGGGVVAVGTTVVRALETAADRDGSILSSSGWTNRAITSDRGIVAVDGLLTGWHEPAASHLRLLQAALDERRLDYSYSAALEHGYLWHEFGDTQLILP
jgi:S-adenosylmethionine:tRNA ribosyltransferase-isomerase